MKTVVKVVSVSMAIALLGIMPVQAQSGGAQSTTVLGSVAESGSAQSGSALNTAALNTAAVNTAAVNTAAVNTAAQSTAAQSESAQHSTAQVTAAPSYPREYRVDSLIESPRVLNQEGTSSQQEQLLMKINTGLINGSISPEEASRFKNQLNQVSDQESWYRSLNSQIPASIVEQNKTLIAQISQKLQPDVVRSATTNNSLHADIDDLIGAALARNAISSSDAEKYYMRLAQIESNLSTTKSAKASAAQQAGSSSDLRALRAELANKADAIRSKNSR